MWHWAVIILAAGCVLPAPGVPGRALSEPLCLPWDGSTSMGQGRADGAAPAFLWTLSVKENCLLLQSTQ